MTICFKSSKTFFERYDTPNKDFSSLKYANLIRDRVVQGA